MFLEIRDHRIETLWTSSSQNFLLRKCTQILIICMFLGLAVSFGRFWWLEIKRLCEPTITRIFFWASAPKSSLCYGNIVHFSTWDIPYLQMKFKKQSYKELFGVHKWIMNSLLLSFHHIHWEQLPCEPSLFWTPSATSKLT